MSHVQNFNVSYASDQQTRPGPREWHSDQAIFLGTADFLSVLIVPATACFFTRVPNSLEKNVLFWNLVAGVTTLLIASYRGYRFPVISQAKHGADLAICCFFVTNITMLSAALLMGHAHVISRYWTTAQFCVTPLCFMLGRSLSVVKLTPQVAGGGANGSIVVCFDRMPKDISGAIAAHNLSPDIAGVLYLNGHPTADAAGNAIADIQTMLDIIRAKKIHDVIFIHQPELEQISSEARQELLADLMGYPVRIWLAFDLRQLPDILSHRLGHYMLLPIVSDQLLNSLNATKRLFDLVFSSLLLILVAPLIGAIALLLGVSDRGPIVFRQVRTGAQGHRFTVLKFRTMKWVSGSPFVQASRHDVRVTRIGRFLRRTSLDELLQLVNVLRGDMSLVGPRPHAPETQVQGMSFEDAVKSYRLRHRVKPGITGLAQIRGQRGETPAVEFLQQRISSDLEYIETWSVWLDINILLRTLPTVIKQKNAW